MPRSPITRRDLVVTGGALAGSLLVRTAAAARPRTTGSRPVAVASHNGLAAVKLAVERMVAGEGPVDAAVAGVGVNESDPGDISVGYGGIPNEDGVVQLDAAVMDGTLMRAGAVAALEGIRHPAQVARDVMRRTTRILLVGDGALAFARALGYEEENLLTERARKIWLYWKGRASSVDDWMAPPESELDPEVREFVRRRTGTLFPSGGTIHLSAVDATGAAGCCTTTSGLFFKLPGRVGDSPLVGCGLYCDSEVGSAGATGHGESCIISNGARTVVELMRQGASPREACLAAQDRIARDTRAPWLLDEKGRPRNSVSLYAVSRDGEVGSAATWSGRTYAVCRAGEDPRLEPADWIFDAADR